MLSDVLILLIQTNHLEMPADRQSNGGIAPILNEDGTPYVWSQAVVYLIFEPPGGYTT
jgi:hypothetical protein